MAIRRSVRWVAALALWLAAGSAGASMPGRICSRIQRHQDDPVVSLRATDSMLRYSARRCASGGRASRIVALGGNLHPMAPLDTFVDDGTVGSAFSTSNYATSADVFDALGGARMLFLFLTHEGPQSWTVQMGVADEASWEIIANGGGRFQIVDTANHRITFGRNGRVVAGRIVRVTLPGDGAPQLLSVDLSGLTESAAPSGVSCVLQDGCAMARGGRASRLTRDRSAFASATR